MSVAALRAECGVELTSTPLDDGPAGEAIRQLRQEGITAPVVLLLGSGPDEVLREPVTPAQIQHLAGRLLEPVR